MKECTLDHHSKSLPATEFPASPSDSGIDSDIASSTKLSNSLEDIEVEFESSPFSFLLGENSPQQERIRGINNAIGWIREELQNIKTKDKELTKTFITLRAKIAKEKENMENEYYGGSDNELLNDEPKSTKEKWHLIATDGAFPTDGQFFENNKRATWAI